MAKKPQTQKDTEEEKLYQSLRAGTWGEFKGQEKLKKSLQISLDAARKRGDVLEHVMLYGPPGLGKTTLAHIIAKEMNVNINTTSGPALERAGDLASILTNLEQGDILFIDEIHRLNKVVEETLYPAMEDFALDIVLGKGPGARTVRLELKPFTLVGATTQAGKISSPLRDRFGVVHRMEFYKDGELAEIVIQAAEKMSVDINKKAALDLASRSRKTARIALKLLKRVRDFAEVYSHSVIDEVVIKKALDMLEVDEYGLDANDRMVLEVMIDKHDGGPVGLSTLSASVAEDIATIEDVYEPFLMRAGFLKRTPQGRVVTQKAYELFGKSPKNKKSDQESLL
ncbi:Holliday junction branch migration DNA helicase RuvB [Candidatus Woesebacteria bacterium]|nr:Holliday junction branch migration DNA helicase RuvB [Candidatus Woesebacteria bacterium]